MYIPQVVEDVCTWNPLQIENGRRTIEKCRKDLFLNLDFVREKDTLLQRSIDAQAYTFGNRIQLPYKELTDYRPNQGELSWRSRSVFTMHLIAE